MERSKSLQRNGEAGGAAKAASRRRAGRLEGGSDAESQQSENDPLFLNVGSTINGVAEHRLDVVGVAHFLFIACKVLYTDQVSSKQEQGRADLLGDDGVVQLDQRQVSFITAVLMAVALCFHSVLEAHALSWVLCAFFCTWRSCQAVQGAAMGAQETIKDTLDIFIAIVAHKGLAAYALGSSIVDSGALISLDDLLFKIGRALTH